jgi:hypothetical protein
MGAQKGVMIAGINKSPMGKWTFIHSFGGKQQIVDGMTPKGKYWRGNGWSSSAKEGNKKGGKVCKGGRWFWGNKPINENNPLMMAAQR